MKNVIKKISYSVFGAFLSKLARKNPGILNIKKDSALTQTMKSRAAFFVPEYKNFEVSTNPVYAMVNFDPCMVVGATPNYSKWLKRLRSGVFDLDFRTNPLEGWEWIDLLTYATDWHVDLTNSQQRWNKVSTAIKAKGLGKVYVFGTGPSLGNAGLRDWDDGIRIVSNTIVRDPDLWKHINPDLFVAGDGIYHFGFTIFAKTFRADLLARMQEKAVPFVYPAQFDAIVQREFAEFGDYLIPIPGGTHKNFHTDLRTVYQLPALGNVLNLLLLPLACNLSKNVNLWGFDGRAPNDTGFWSNASKQSYPELIHTLREAHPAFFDENVPKIDPEKYIRFVHGDVLEFGLQQAEKEGWTFTMLHETYTQTLKNRLIADA